MAADPVALRMALLEFGREFHARAPVDLLEGARELIARLDEWGVPIVEPPPPPLPPVAEVREASPRRVELGVNQTGQVVARTPEAEPVARTLRTILDLLAKKPLGSMAQVALEFAAHIEALELENEDLRRALGER